MKRTLLYSGAASVSALLFVTTSAFAQSSGGDAAVEEIVVTAQKRSESVQKTPLAVNSSERRQFAAAPGDRSFVDRSAGAKPQYV